MKKRLEIHAVTLRELADRLVRILEVEVPLLRDAEPPVLDEHLPGTWMSSQYIVDLPRRLDALRFHACWPSASVCRRSARFATSREPGSFVPRSGQSGLPARARDANEGHDPRTARDDQREHHRLRGRAAHTR